MPGEAPSGAGSARCAQLQDDEIPAIASRANGVADLLLDELRLHRLSARLRHGRAGQALLLRRALGQTRRRQRWASRVRPPTGTGPSRGRRLRETRSAKTTAIETAGHADAHGSSDASRSCPPRRSSARLWRSPRPGNGGVSRSCGDDAELRRQIDRLLAHDYTAGAFLVPPGATIPAPSLIPEKIGGANRCYKLLEQIGEGGMGVVFMAEQTQPVRRQVALKIIKPGMDTRQVDRPLRGRAAGAGADGSSRTSPRCSTPARPTPAGRTS